MISTENLEKVNNFLTHLESKKEYTEKEAFEMLKHNPSKLNNYSNSLSMTNFKTLINYYLNIGMMSIDLLLMLKIRNLLKDRNEIFDLKDNSELYFLYFLKLNQEEQIKIFEANPKSIAFLDLELNSELMKLAIIQNPYIINEIRNTRISYDNYIYGLNYDFLKFYVPFKISEENIKLSIELGNKEAIQYVESFTFEEEQKIIEKYGIKVFKHFKKPTFETIKKSFDIQNDIFQYVSKEVNDEFKKYALQKAGYVIQWICCPDLDMLELSLRNNLNNLKHVIELTKNRKYERENILKIAVELDVHIINKIPKYYHTVDIAEIVINKNQYLINKINTNILEEISKKYKS